MEKRAVAIGNPIVIGGLTLIPIAKVSVNCAPSKGGISFFGAKQPLAVVVVSASAKKALRITGEEVSIDQLIQEIPDINETLKGIQASPKINRSYDF